MKQSESGFLSQGEIVQPESDTLRETTITTKPTRFGKYGLIIRIRTCKIRRTLDAIGQNVKIDCKCISIKKGVRYYQITISESDVAPGPEKIFRGRPLIASFSGSLDEFQFLIKKESLLRASKRRPYKGIWIVLLMIKKGHIIKVLA